MRQCCNVAYAVLAEGMSDEEAEQLDISIGMNAPAEDAALAALAAHQEAAGMTFADPGAPVPAPEPA